MARTGIWLLMLAGAAGCFGVSQNPSYFPYLLPTGDVVRTHAKPIGPAYYANFDPHAFELSVEPQVLSSQVGSQVVLLATVRDEKGMPRRDRRVEWMVTGGQLIEVDESGILPGRGYSDGASGVSFTAHHEHRLTRGNDNKLDDVMIRPGQTWCVISSPVEGDSHVQVVVPGISNWDKRMKTAVVRWVDAAWELPPPARASAADPHELRVKVMSFTERKPLAKYRVRFKILDGPPAILLPSRLEEDTVVTDLDGLAKVRILRLSIGAGASRVGVEILRPPDPTVPSGSALSIVKGDTAIEWFVPVELKQPQEGPSPLGPPIPSPEPKLEPLLPTLPKGGLGPPVVPPPEPKLGPPGMLGPPQPR